MRGRLEAIPAGRFGELEEFGALAAFICSQRAGYITGTIMRIDGGQIKSML
jgi:3-oxoacyl-[acyl-carrier protein] reductase